MTERSVKNNKFYYLKNIFSQIPDKKTIQIKNSKNSPSFWRGIYLLNLIGQQLNEIYKLTRRLIK